MLMTVTSEVVTRAAHEREVAAGERFEFGRNWTRFLELIDDTRIRQAEESLAAMLRESTLDGKTFLDIGSGSGLFSLAARRLGARVHSFDFDTRSLGTFDIVYSWGVLHHTGRMWDAIHAATRAVAPGGKLFIAIYNDTGSQTERWRAIKRLYNRLPAALRPALALLTSAPDEGKALARAIVRGTPREFVDRWSANNARGMNHWRDIIDWVGGYPYEVAAPEEIFEFCRTRGFSLVNLRCRGVGLGCNEFVFVRDR
jgi:hypothetical protein